jgi:predicted Zn-dependent protease
MFARAAVTGRLVQQKGLMAAHLVPEIERCARRSRDLDPDFRGGAATRLLGTMYVMAPAVLLQHGDSEEGLQLLEGLVQTHPKVPENHLRLAEAYIALGDPAPAGPHLCRCLADKAALRPDDQRLLQHLIDGAGLPPCAPATVVLP